MKAICNQLKLVMLSVMGQIHHPVMQPNDPYRVSVNGVPYVLPSIGGITYNVSIGDSVFGLAGDHIEPGVSLKNPSDQENMALNTYSCIGNTAIVVSGDAKGAHGYVTGTHGGVDHVIVHFAANVLESLCIDDKILIRSYGQGMEIMGFESTVHVMNLDPTLFERMNITIENNKISVPVVATIPAHLMGSGTGKFTCHNGDYDLMTSDISEIKKYGLDRLRLGDIVLLDNCDNSYGRSFRSGAVSIGVVIHGDCIQAGHGPGITTLLTAQIPVIIGCQDPNANLVNFLGI